MEIWLNVMVDKVCSPTLDEVDHRGFESGFVERLVRVLDFKGCF